MTKDSADVAIQWSDGQVESLDRKEIRVLLRARRAKLYSYWFE